MKYSPFARDHPLGRCGAGELKSGWFRHPALLAGPPAPPDDEHNSWVKDVRPRLVITVGRAACLTRCRGLWPMVPEILLLSRRDPSSVDAVDSITGEGWSPLCPDSEQAKESLSPGSGIEVGCWAEDHAPMPVYDQEDEEPAW